MRSTSLCLAVTVGWPRGEATDCKSVYTGSNPVPTSKEFEVRVCSTRAIGAAVARFPDTEEVTGSNPVSPTRNMQARGPFGVSFRFGERGLDYEVDVHQELLELVE